MNRGPHSTLSELKSSILRLSESDVSAAQEDSLSSIPGFMPYYFLLDCVVEPIYLLASISR